MAAAAVTSYGIAFKVNHELGLEGYSPMGIALLTLATKEAIFLPSNTIYHSLFCSPCYESFPEFGEDVKEITISNLSAASFSLAAQASLHYVCMKSGLDPVTAMWWSYVPIGVGGTALKLAIDFRNGVFGKKNEPQKLEQILEGDTAS